MYKRVVKNLWIALLCTAIQIGCFSGGYRVSAKLDVASSKYRAILSKRQISINNKKLNKNKTSYAIKDINHDGTKELLLIHKGESYGDSFLIIATYYKGKVRVVYDDMWRGDIIKIYKKGSIFYVQSQMTVQYKDFYQIKKGKLVKVAGYVSDKDYEDINESGSGYYLGKNNKEVSEKDFKIKIKKWTKGTKECKVKYEAV